MLKVVGGEGNVNSVVYCVICLCFKLKDENKVDIVVLNVDLDVI